MAEDIIRFKRKLYDTMLKWKQERNGNTALLIQGARRVGKSTIVEEFARNEYKSYILIDFSKVSKDVSDLFNDISDLKIDFIITDKHKISPIEVKSSGYKSHKSLDEFCTKFSDCIMNKYVIYTKDYKRENGVDYIPVYMTMFL